MRSLAAVFLAIAVDDDNDIVLLLLLNLTIIFNIIRYTILTSNDTIETKKKIEISCTRIDFSTFRNDAQRSPIIRVH